MPLSNHFTDFYHTTEQRLWKSHFLDYVQAVFCTLVHRAQCPVNSVCHAPQTCV